MQSTNTILMIEPVAFGYNAQTAVNNYFQNNASNEETQLKALQEFKELVEKLRSKGIQVITVQDTLSPHTPDSIYPNNWVSFHQDGRVSLFPMFAENRRTERREDILYRLREEGFEVGVVKDYSDYELENKYLEGTGAMILDRENRIAYGAESIRLNKEVFEKWCEDFGYRPVLFKAFQSIDGKRLPIYHTNVMMGLGADYAIICLDTIDDEEERKNVIQNLEATHKEIIEISEEQMNRFAGNMLEVQNNKGEKFLVMSAAAYKSLTPAQIQRIETHAEIIYSDVHTIEENGGGSVRCMMAEVFLPKK